MFTPSEHRNMPVDDALLLVHRDFQDYVRQTRRRNSRDIVPSDIRNLMLDLLEARNLSMGDLDKLIKYLKERQNILVDDQIEQKRESAGECPLGLKPFIVSSPSSICINAFSRYMYLGKYVSTSTNEPREWFANT